MDYGIGEVEKAILKALDSNQYSYQTIYYYLNHKAVQPVKANTISTFPRVQPVGLTGYDNLLAGEAR